MGKTAQQLTALALPIQDTDIFVVARGAGLLQEVSGAGLKGYVGVSFGMQKVASANFSAATNITVALPAGFVSFHILIDGLTPSVAAGLGLQMSFDNGATYKSGASDYSIAATAVTTGSATVLASQSLTLPSIPLYENTIGATPGNGNTFEMDVIMPRGAGFSTSVLFRSSYLNSTPQFENVDGSGRIIPGYGIPTTIKITPTTGTVSGQLTVYGNP